MNIRPSLVFVAVLALLAPAIGQPVGERGPAAAFTPPKAPNPAKYKGLADNSPFTIRPDPIGPAPEEPPPDISLIGCVPIGGKMNAVVQPAGKEEPIQLVEGIRDEGTGLLLVGVKGAESMFTAVAEIEANGKIIALRFTDAGLTLTPGAGAAKTSGQGQNARQPHPKTAIQNPPPAAGPPPAATPRRRLVVLPQ